MHTVRYRMILAGGLVTIWLAPCVQAAQPVTDAQIEVTIQQLVREIKNAGTTHGWEEGPPPAGQEMTTPPEGAGPFGAWRKTPANYGGLTALAVTALLTAGVDPRADEQMTRAIEWLSRVELVGNYALSFRLQAFSKLLAERPALRNVMLQDVASVTQAQLSNGNWWYVSTTEKNREGTNSNGQLAVLGLWSAAQAGLGVPPSLWQKVEKHWADGQHPDGGWGYQERYRAQSYGSMTASGVATLYILLEQLHGEQFVTLRGGTTTAPLSKGLAWLGQHFMADSNPDYGSDKGDDAGRTHWAYWLYSLERASQAGGIKHLPGPGGRINWFREGAGHIVQMAAGRRSLKLEEMCFALIFLAKGNAPIFIHKLEWAGDWNQRPHDAAVACRYIDRLFERRVNWYSVTLDATPQELLEAPVLYVSGTQAVKLTPAQLANLKAYLDAGGLLWAEATGGKTSMTGSVRQLLSGLYPAGRWERLTAEHPFLSGYIKTSKLVPGDLLTVDGKTLALLSGVDLSRPLQTYAQTANREVFDLTANIFAWLVKGGKFKRKLSVIGPGQIVEVPAPPPAGSQPTGAGPTGPEGAESAGAGAGAAQPSSLPEGVYRVTDGEAISKAMVEGRDIRVQGQVDQAEWNAKASVFRIRFAGAETSRLNCVVFGPNRKTFEAACAGDLSKYLCGAVIQVSGKVSEYHGAPQIILNDPAQLVKVK